MATNIDRYPGEEALPGNPTPVPVTGEYFFTCTVPLQVTLTEDDECWDTQQAREEALKQANAIMRRIVRLNRSLSDYDDLEPIEP